MQNLSLPPVFKDFTTGFNVDIKNKPSVVNTSTEGVPSVGDKKTKDEKNTNNHLAVKILSGVLVACGAILVFVPMIRKHKFAQVNPNLINLNEKNAKIKKNFIKFSDNLEIRRNMCFQYIKDRINALYELIRRNFFSYNYPSDVPFSPMKDIPKNFVRSILKEINNFTVFCSKVAGKIDIDYTNFTKS